MPTEGRLDPPRPERFSTSQSYWLVPALLLALSLGTAATAFLFNTRERANVPAPAEVKPSITRGGVFRFPLLWPVVTLDPARARLGEIIVIQQIFDGLTAFDEHLNIVPALAEYWRISPDGKTYTFELRRNAQFHNGRPVTAEDCVFSLQRLVTPGLNQDNYHYFSRIEGVEEYRAGRAKTVSGLRALDERTFQIRFTTAFVPALSVLGMYSSKILPKDELLAQGEEFFRAPIGTGPFRFGGWVDRHEGVKVPFVKGLPQAIRLDANASYFGGAPYLDGVLFRAAWNAAGDEHPLNELVDCFPNVEEQYEDWVAVEAERLLALSFLVLPHVPPFDDARVRRALNYALDKRSFLDTSRVTAGIPPAVGIVPPGIPGFLPVETSYGHDLRKARALLLEAGYPNGRGLPSVEMAVYEGYDSRERVGCLIGCMSRIGLEVKAVKVKRGHSLQDRPMMFRPQTWFADFPDPDNFLRPLFHSESPVNLASYRNPTVDQLLDRAWTETSYSTRNKIYRKIEKMILRDSPIIPLDYGSARFLVRPNIRGFHLSPLGPDYVNMKKIWLAPPPAAAGSEL